MGVPDYLSVRLLSIFVASGSLFLLLGIQQKKEVNKYFLQSAIFTFYFIPSIFLWTSLGMRESFIIAELTAFFVGLDFFMHNRKKYGFLLLFCGSYGLLCTKNYLWLTLLLATALSFLFFLINKHDLRQLLMLGLAAILLPLILFASTTSSYALNYLFNSNLMETGARSGDSITNVEVKAPEIGTTTGTTTITFHGDYSLIALHSYFTNNPTTPLSQIARLTKFDKKIEGIWEEKVAIGISSKNKQVGNDSSTLSSHILTPGKIRDPISMLRAAAVFLFGPFPFIEHAGVVRSIASLESPLWWSLYVIVILQLIRFRKARLLYDPVILLTLVFIIGEICFSALVEVNLGTSFRHRSILLVPLIFLYVRTWERSKE